MKISATLFALVNAGNDVCGDCATHVVEFNNWHKQDNIVCSRYTDPRVQFADSRAACKECKIQCVPNEDMCPGTSELEAGFWNKTALKLQAQYINRADEMAQERMIARREGQFAKEQAKFEKIKNKIAEKKAKQENKAAKAADWAAWREEKRQRNVDARAQKKQEKKDAKAAAKALKAFKKEQREKKRQLAEENKVLFSFYSDLEEHYDALCPDMFLIENNDALARQYNNFKALMEVSS